MGASLIPVHNKSSGEPGRASDAHVRAAAWNERPVGGEPERCGGEDREAGGGKHEQRGVGDRGPGARGLERCSGGGGGGDGRGGARVGGAAGPGGGGGGGGGAGAQVPRGGTGPGA